MKALFIMFVLAAAGFATVAGINWAIGQQRAAQSLHLECPCGTAKDCNCDACECPTKLIHNDACPSCNE